ncbi:hypothetical protein [Halopseudomonas salegens]|uniref:Uncharacterized protein n=1 Tax=Halopseudomonas salegens TaxID=1434072 RepID=A0A1H2EQW7_9GAMM|nr:hypothetical protein [Halopseudomonas salegens]SDT97481.1 hypothetical protein SAMN05216210_0959 [Halopseudomonas salegens]
MKLFGSLVSILLFSAITSTGCKKSFDMSKYYFVPQYQTGGSDVLSYGFTFDWGAPVVSDDENVEIGDELVSFNPAIRIISVQKECNADLESLEILSKGEVEIQLTKDDVVRASESRWVMRGIHLTKSDKVVRISFTTSCTQESIISEFEFSYVEKIEKVNFFTFISRQ